VYYSLPRFLTFCFAIGAALGAATELITIARERN